MVKIYFFYLLKNIGTVYFKFFLLSYRSPFGFLVFSGVFFELVF